MTRNSEFFFFRPWKYFVSTNESKFQVKIKGKSPFLSGKIKNDFLMLLSKIVELKSEIWDIRVFLHALFEKIWHAEKCRSVARTLYFWNILSKLSQMAFGNKWLRFVQLLGLEGSIFNRIFFKTLATYAENLDEFEHNRRKII